MDEAEILKSAALEQRHWWYAGRRALVRRLMRGVPAGRGLDVGCGSGGNTETLRDLGWAMTAVEFSPAGARLTATRGLDVVRGDGRRLPFADASFDLVMSTDVWEHVDDDAAMAREAFRVLRPGGRLLVAVPAGADLWSGHDVALGHLRRYDRAMLTGVVASAGFSVHSLRSWNVLLRPVARLRRRSGAAARTDQATSEMESVHPILNTALRTVVALEASLPVHHLPGVSLVIRAVKPG